MNEQERNKVINWYENFCYEHKIDTDIFDINAEIDSNISADENINIIEEKLKNVGDSILSEQVKRHKMIMAQQTTDSVFNIDLDNTDSVAVVGDRNSGKTNLAFYLMNTYKGKRNKYLYGYPIRIEGYKSIATWGDLLKVTNSIIFIDEIQRYIRIYDKRANNELMGLLSFLAHQNNTIIFTTQLSQFITKGVEASIQTWLIKQLDLLSLKNGCKIKRILREIANPKITDKGISLYVNEFIAYDSTMPIGFNGLKTFTDQHIKKDWRNSDNKCD